MASLSQSFFQAANGSQAIKLSLQKHLALISLPQVQVEILMTSESPSDNTCNAIVIHYTMMQHYLFSR